MVGFTFPHIKINVFDDSIPTLAPPDPPGLHVPFFIGYAPKGKPNVPFYGSGATIMKRFGEKTLDMSSPYFMHPNLFLRYACVNQAVYFTRVVPEDAKSASLVLELTIKPAQITQYRRDIYGGIIVDSNGDPIPLLEDDGITPVKEDGYEGTFSTRQLDEDEDYNDVRPLTSVVNGVTQTRYPIFAMAARSVGKEANLSGFKVYYTNDYVSSVVNSIGSMTFRFAPIYKNETTDIAIPIRSKFSESFVDFSFDPKAKDSKTDSEYSLDKVIKYRYTVWLDDKSQAFDQLDYDIHCYSNYYKDIANLILTKSPELENTNPYMLNLLSGVDRDDNPYSHYTITNHANFVNENKILYLSGGDDGEMTVENLEKLVVSYLTGDIYPEIKDNFRYPFNFFYDSGFSLENKKAFTNFLSIRRDVKIDYSTQDASLEPNTPAEDLSTGSALRARILLHPESTLYGTPCVRASIYQQCGVLNEYPNLELANFPDVPFTVPANLHRLIARCQTDARSYIRADARVRGRPQSDVTIFKIDGDNNIPWTPFEPTHKQLCHDTGLNYFQYGDKNSLFYPDYRSVYPYDRSVLSSDTFVDKLVYINGIQSRIWTIYSGREDDINLLRVEIANVIDKQIIYAFSGSVPTKTIIFQTEEEKTLGYQWSIQTELRGDVPLRIFNVTLVVRRRS